MDRNLKESIDDIWKSNINNIMKNATIYKLNVNIFKNFGLD